MICPMRNAIGNVNVHFTSCPSACTCLCLPDAPDWISIASSLRLVIGRSEQLVKRKQKPNHSGVTIMVDLMVTFPEISRIIEVEKKIDGIYSLLQTGPVRQSRLVPQPPETLTPQSLTSGEGVSRESEGSPFQDASPNASHVTSSSTYCEEASVSVDVFQLGIITVHEAEVLLDASLLEYGDFPWVVLPSRLPLDLFRREKPILLLSLLALASRRQALLHDSLVREFKNIISAKVIMDGSPDLDLLQSLLLYLAW